MLDDLEFGDRASELGPLPRVGEGSIEGGTTRADPHSSHDDAFVNKTLCELLESLTFNAKDGIGRNYALIEVDGCGVGGVPTEFLQRRSDVKSWRVTVDYEH